MHSKHKKENKTLRAKKALLIGIFSFLILAGGACGGEQGQEGPPRQITLEWWTVFKEPADLTPIINAYRARFPHVVINVRQLRPDEFEQSLINALAEDRGPDIFTIHNTAVREYLTKIAPMPTTTTMQVAVERGAVRKSIFTEDRTYNSFSQRYLTGTFTEQVLLDAQINDVTYGLPLSMDSLALFYNRTLLSQAGIPLPARNYSELQEHSIRLTRQNTQGQITQSGVPIGTHDNIPRFSDILSLLMMQNGTQMTDDVGNATFDSLPPSLAGRSTLPAADALIFYTDFANPSKQVYNWNDNRPDALEAFMSGQTAYFLGYAYHIPIIRAQSPRLNFGITSMPQIEGNPTVNFANYWLEVVSQKSDHQDAAWNFLQFSSQPENVEVYLDRAKLPTATRQLIETQTEDPDIGVFADQVLTARSWYRGTNPDIVPQAFAQMIDEILTGTLPVNQVLQNARAIINQTIR